MSTQQDLILPDVPAFNQNCFKAHRVHSDSLGELEALVPNDARYQCANAEAPALVLVPGLGMDGLGYIRQLPLGPLAHLHLFQTPNETVSGEPGLHGFAHAVESYITSQKLDQHPGGVFLGGCSMGGAISLAVAIRGRIRLRGLVLIGTFGSCNHLPRWQRLAAPLAGYLPWGLARKVAWQVVARTPFFGKVNPQEADWLVSCKVKRTRAYFGRAVNALTTQQQIADAAKLKLPTLVVHGTHDNVLPIAAGQELAQTIPGARFVSVQNAGHAIFFKNYEVVNQEIGRFIGEH